MVTKGHDSPEYYAQTLRDFLVDKEGKKTEKGKKGYMAKNFGAVWPVKQMGSTVQIPVYGFETHIKFFKQGNVDYVEVEINSLNGASYSETTKFKPERSKPGRLSPNKTFPKFLDEFVILNFKKLRGTNSNSE